MTELVINEQIYNRFVKKEIPLARKFLWIATADIKDMFIEEGGQFRPFLELLAELLGHGVEIRLIHAKEPGPRFREEFDRFPDLIQSDRFDRILCPRVHFKAIIVDGRIAYTGSANLTGAGMGARHPDKRNFETGIVTDDPALMKGLMELFDAVFLGDYCTACRMREDCPDPIV